LIENKRLLISMVRQMGAKLRAGREVRRKNAMARFLAGTRLWRYHLSRAAA
jgi:hypothetical protein